ncbi:MAG: hypothetical protein MJ132_00005, partial [Clostridia bacterium]|nr:hypothetical protein [Clostridia bacterium]
MIKRILSVLLVAALLFTLFAVTASAETTELVITDCDTTEGWVNTSGNGVTVNVNGYGTNSAIHRDINYGAYRALTYNLPAALDISDYTAVEWDAMFYSRTKNGAEGTMWEQIVANYVDNGNNLYLKLVSANGAYRVYRFSKLNSVVSTTNSNWVHFTATVDDYTSEIGGTFDATQLTAFYFSTVDGAVNTTVDNGFIRLDNIKATKTVVTPPEEPEDPEDPADPETPVEDFVLSDCESADGWNYAGNGGINVSNAGYTGKAILMNTGYGALRRLTYTPETAVDLSAYNRITWDLFNMKNGDMTDIWEDLIAAYSSQIKLEVSDGTHTATIGFSDMETTALGHNWYELSADLTKAAGVNLSAVTSVAMYVTVNSANTSLPSGVTYKVDNLKATYVGTTPDHPAVPTEDTIISECESADGWVYSGNGGINVSNAGYTGKAILMTAGYGALRRLTYTPETALNLSGYNRIQWDLFNMENSGMTDIWNAIESAYASEIKLEISDGTNTATIGYANMEVSALGHNWYRLSADLTKATNVNLATITSVAMYVTVNSANTSVPERTTYKVDNVKAVYVEPEPETSWNIPGEKDWTGTGTFSYSNNSFSINASRFPKEDLYLLMSIYVENTEDSNSVDGFCTEGQIELTSSGQSDLNEINWNPARLNLHAGWNHLRLQLSTSSAISTAIDL